MNRDQFFANLRILLSSALMFFTLSTFPQAASGLSEKSRPIVNHKRLHSLSLSDQSDDLFADGLKLKLDLSVLEEAKDRREELDPTAIPADDVYEGIWVNRNVNVYGSLKNAPDTFVVNLENFTMPTDGHMTSNFGRRGSSRYHYGIDIKAYTGDTIYAAFDGKIRVKQFERNGYGYYLVIRHINGLETVYGHLSKFLVDENEFVRSGQPIGLAGNTGRSFGSHLHFETRFLGNPINPNFIIDFQNKVPHRDEYLVTRSSYRKTSRSSSVTVASSSNYKPATNRTNKYVSGNVKYHRIKRGDTLGAIAKRYGVSVSQLCKLNNMKRNSILRVGKSLRIS